MSFEWNLWYAFMLETQNIFFSLLYVCVFVSPIYIKLWTSKLYLIFIRTLYLININVTFQNIIALGKYIQRCLLYIKVEELKIGMT